MATGQSDLSLKMRALSTGSVRGRRWRAIQQLICEHRLAGLLLLAESRVLNPASFLFDYNGHFPFEQQSFLQLQC